MSNFARHGRRKRYPDVYKHVGNIGCASEGNKEALIAPGYDAFDVGCLTAHQLEVLQVEQAQSCCW